MMFGIRTMTAIALGGLLALLLSNSGSVGAPSRASETSGGNTAKADGYWKLVDLDFVPPNDAVKEKIEVASSMQAGSLTTRLRFRDPNAQFQEHVVTTTWSRIPRALQPGQDLPFRLQMTQVQKGEGLGIQQAWGYVSLLRRQENAKQWPDQGLVIRDTDAKGNGQWVGGGLPDPGNVGAVTYTEPGKYAIEGVGKVPDEGPGQLAILVFVEHSQVTWRWYYIYDWVEGNVPSNLGEPIAPTATNLSQTIDTDDVAADDSRSDVSRPDDARTDDTRPDDSRSDDTRSDNTRPADTRTDDSRPDDAVTNDSRSDSDKTPATGRVLKAPKVTVEKGQTVAVPIYLIRPDGVANMNYNVSYSSDVARPEGNIRRGNLLDDSALISANPNETNLVRLGFARPEGLQPTGTVAVITFRAVGEPGDCTPLTLAALETQDAQHQALPIALVHGEICIVAKRMLGDCTGDGILTVADAQCALDMSVGLRPSLDFMDMDDDGQVTSGDAQIILRNLQWGTEQ